MAVKIYNLSDAAITPTTIRKMHEMVKKAKTDMKFINLVTDFVKKCKAKDILCEVKTLYNTFKELITYRPDPYQVEMIKSVWHILETRTGDCDDCSILMAAGAGALGKPYQFVTIKSDLSRPNEYSHVYPRISVKGKWLGADLTVQKAYLGWEPPEYYERKIWKEPVY